MPSRASIFKEFLEDTGAETLSAIGLASTTFGKIVHILFALACLGVLSATCYNIAQQYKRYETDTFIEVKLCD